MATISLNTSPHYEQKMLNGVLTLLGCDSSNQTFDKTFEIILSLKLFSWHLVLEVAPKNKVLGI